MKNRFKMKRQMEKIDRKNETQYDSSIKSIIQTK